MASLLRSRSAQLWRQQAGQSSAVSHCRGFQSGTPAQAAAKKGVKPPVGKRAQSVGGIGKNKKKKAEGPRRAESHALVTLDHPLWKPQTERNYPSFNPVDLPEHVERPMSFPTVKHSPIAAFGVPENLQEEFVHVRHPFSIVRQSTLGLLDHLDELVAPKEVINEGSNTQSDSTQSNRLVLNGPSGCGKSVMLLQAVHACLQNNWIVYYVPRGIDWVNSSAPYSYDYRSQLFHQHTLAEDALQKILLVNQTQLARLRLDKDVPLPGGKPGAVVKAGTNLDVLAQYGVKDPLVAPQTLVLLFDALRQQTETPVLVAVDDFQALYNTTAYRDPQFKRISSYHLSMPRLILELASGKRPLARGAVLGAISTANSTYGVIDPLRKALSMRWPGDHVPSPYDPMRSRYSKYTTGLQNWELPDSFSTSEAACLMDVWNRQRLFHSALNDSFFLAKYTETGGNPRQLMRKGILASLQA